jgi:hypothetical protein
MTRHNRELPPEKPTDADEREANQREYDPHPNKEPNDQADVPESANDLLNLNGFGFLGPHVLDETPKQQRAAQEQVERTNAEDEVVHLGKERFEFAEHNHHDVVADLDKLAADWRTSQWHPVSERYVNGEIVVHVHFGIQSGLTGESSAYCALFKRPLELPGDNGVGAIGPCDGQANIGTVGDHASQGDMPVLVDVGEFADDDQWVGRKVRSVVRLQPLDCCLGGRGKADKSCEFSAGEPSGIVADRELNALDLLNGENAGLPLGFLHGDAVGQVVERTPEVVGDVAQPQRPGDIGQRLVEVEASDIAVRLRIEVSPNGVWIVGEKFPEVAGKCLDVFYRPV